MSEYGPHIYDYLDPILYLNDYFEYRKNKNPHFTQRLFAQKAGIKSTGYICEVLKRQRSLTPKRVENFLSAMQLTKNESEFFRAMVSYSRAKNHESRIEWRHQLEQLQPSPLKRLNKVVAQYYAKWYHIAVREALALGEYQGKFESFAGDLAHTIFPKITRTEAMTALEFLHKNGFIIKDGSGHWAAKHKSLTAGSSELGKTYLRDFQYQMMDLAKEALYKVEPSQRNISCTTMSISEDGMNKIGERISQFHTEVVQLIQADCDEDRLYQFNVQFFPVGGTYQNEKSQ